MYAFYLFVFIKESLKYTARFCKITNKSDFKIKNNFFVKKLKQDIIKF